LILEIVQDQVNQFAEFILAKPPVIVGRLTNNLNLNIKNTHFNYPVIVGRLTNNLNLNIKK